MKCLANVVIALSVVAMSAVVFAQQSDDIYFRIGQRTAPAKPAGVLRLATYNLENLFDTKDDPTLTGREDDMNSVKPEAEKQALAKTIRAIDADVIALQEIESFDALIEFRDQYLSDLGYDHVISIDVGAERGIENAVMSRYPLKDPKIWKNWALGGVHPELYGTEKNWYAGQPMEFRRSPLRVTVTVPKEVTGTGEEYELVVFSVHHKSGRYNDYWREAEAAKLCDMLNEMMKADPDANIAVLGDFNAQVDDKSVQTYVAKGSMRDVLAGKDRGNSKHTTHASGRSIDFIFVNNALAQEVMFESAFVYATPQRPADADWRTTPAPAGYASDHLPLVVDVRVTEE